MRIRTYYGSVTCHYKPAATFSNTINPVITRAWLRFPSLFADGLDWLVNRIASKMEESQYHPWRTSSFVAHLQSLWIEFIPTISGLEALCADGDGGRSVAERGVRPQLCQHSHSLVIQNK